MKLLVASDAYVYETPDGKHWCNKIYGYIFWKRYLDVFDDVKVVARMERVDNFSDGLLVDGPHVEVFGIPCFRGPKQLILNLLAIWKSLKNVDTDCDAALLRIPGITAEITRYRLRKKTPIVGEVVCDVGETQERKVLLSVINRMIELDVKRFCRKANGVSYVTRNALQSHFPSRARLKGENEHYFEADYSTITLSDDAFSGERTYTNIKSLTAVITSVSMESDRKGEKRLIKAIQLARQKGYDVCAIIVGDGSMRPLFEEYARELEIEAYINFTGLLTTPEQVRDILNQANIYVLPTRCEGLPRGIIEAMALGMPVLSTPVGGIPELIEEKYLFDPDDIEAFSNMLCYLIDHEDELTEMSKKNFLKSQEYRNEILQLKRNQFYYKLRNIAEQKNK